MSAIDKEIEVFHRRKTRETEEAGQTAAFFLMCGIDLSQALESSGETRRNILRRLQRLIERERLKGARRHWSYDLNRHIALKQALDRLRGATRDPRPGGGRPQKCGARRRRN